MRFEHDGTSLWYGTADAPAPLGALGPDDDMTVTVAVHPIDAHNMVKIFYRLNSDDATHEVNACWLWNDIDQNIQYYRAVLPDFQTGDHVEYTAVCSGAGRQVPVSPFIQPWPATFRVSSDKDQLGTHGNNRSNVQATPSMRPRWVNSFSPSDAQRIPSSSTATYFTGFEEPAFIQGIWWLHQELYPYLPPFQAPHGVNGRYCCEFSDSPSHSTRPTKLTTSTLPIPEGSSKLQVYFAANGTEQASLGCHFSMNIPGQRPVQISKTIYLRDLKGLSVDQWLQKDITIDLPSSATSFVFSIQLRHTDFAAQNIVYIDDFGISLIQPLPAPDTIFVADESGFVHAVQADTGDELWNGPTGAVREAIISKVTAASGAVYVGCAKAEGGAVVALDAATGQSLWSYATPAPIRASPEIYDDLVIAVDNSLNLHAISRDTGELQWVSTASAAIGSPVYGLYIQGSIAYVVGGSGISAENIERPGASGRLPPSNVWTIEGLDFRVDPGLLFLDDRLYIKDNSGRLWFINQLDGKALWKNREAPVNFTTISNIAISEGVIYWAQGNTLVALRDVDGVELWRTQFGTYEEYEARGVVVAGKAVFISMMAPDIPGIFPSVVGIDTDTREVRWRSQLEGIYTTTLMAFVKGSLLFVAEETNPRGNMFRLYALNAADGTTKWQSFDFPAPIFGREPTAHGLVSIDRSRRYDQYTYLTAHNAYASLAYGWIFAQQTYRISSQLDAGVRALQLDISRTKCVMDLHNEMERCGEDVDGPEAIYLIHEDLASTYAARLVSPTAPKLAPLLVELRTWLDRNPREVVTIYFESQVGPAGRDLLKQTFVSAGLWELIFFANQTNHGQRDDWNIATRGSWPTLDWMIQNGKRLVVFSDHRNSDDGLPNWWEYAVENDYGSKGLEGGCNNRSRSQPLEDQSRTLFLVNHFADWNVGSVIWYPWHFYEMNDRDSILPRAYSCAGIAQRLPNFISVDYVQRGGNGGPMEVVRILNREWASRASRG